MTGNKEEMINDIDLAMSMLIKTRHELEKVGTNEDGKVYTAYSGGYSLAKIKLNCTTVRDLLLGVRKGCEW